MQDGKKRMRWIFAALFAAEVLLLLFAAGRCLFGERYTWTYQESEGLPVGEAKIPLPRGSYLITVDYMAAEDLAYCQAVAETSHGRQTGEEVALPPEKNQRTIEFYLNETTAEFSIEPASYLQEVPAVHIFGITVQKTKRMEARDGFLLFCFFCVLVFSCPAGFSRGRQSGKFRLSAVCLRHFNSRGGSLRSQRQREHLSAVTRSVIWEIFCQESGKGLRRPHLGC